MKDAFLALFLRSWASSSLIKTVRGLMDDGYVVNAVGAVEYERFQDDSFSLACDPADGKHFFTMDKKQVLAVFQAAAERLPAGAEDAQTINAALSELRSKLPAAAELTENDEEGMIAFLAAFLDAFPSGRFDCTARALLGKELELYYTPNFGADDTANIGFRYDEQGRFTTVFSAERISCGLEIEEAKAVLYRMLELDRLRRPEMAQELEALYRHLCAHMDHLKEEAAEQARLDAVDYYSDVVVRSLESAAADLTKKGFYGNGIDCITFRFDENACLCQICFNGFCVGAGQPLSASCSPDEFITALRQAAARQIAGRSDTRAVLERSLEQLCSYIQRRKSVDARTEAPIYRSR